MRVTLVLTHQCNLACAYCYMGEKFNRAMSEKVAWQAVRMALSDTSPVGLSFFGGEPMLEFSRMASATRLASRLGQRTGRRVSFSITSNATILRDSHLQFFRHYGFNVALSLDGLDADHDRHRPFKSGRGSAAQVWANVRRAAAALGPRLTVLMVVNPDTVEGLFDAVSHLRDCGVIRAGLLPNVDTSWDDAHRDAATIQFRRLARFCLLSMRTDRALHLHPFVERFVGLDSRERCGFGGTELSVAPSGRLYPCSRLVGTDRRGDVVVGDVSRGLDVNACSELRARSRSLLACHDMAGACACIPLMPGDTSAQLETQAFFRRLADGTSRQVLQAVHEEEAREAATVLG